MGSGIQVISPSGKVIIDSDHLMPKLYAEGTLTLNDTVEYIQGFPDLYTSVLSFTPTDRIVFPTFAVISGGVWNVLLERNSEGKYSGVRVLGWPNSAVKVWVYFL